MSDLAERLATDARRSTVLAYVAGNRIASIGALLVCVLAVVAVTGPWIVPQDPLEQSFLTASQGPSAEHWLGTDSFGRDVFSRVLLGTRASLSIGVTAPALAALFGTWAGMLAGYFGGWVEIVIMRVTDIALAIPPLVMALAVAAVLNPSLVNSMLAVAVLWWTWHTRLVYSITRQVRTQEFIEAAETLGASKAHIIFREILPNCISAIAVKASLDAGFVILVGASLSFLGLGIQPPTPDLGTMVSSGAAFLPDKWWESVLPGCAILFVALGFNLLGDGLRDLFDVQEVR